MALLYEEKIGIFPQPLGAQSKCSHLGSKSGAERLDRFRAHGAKYDEKT